jgi:hypothetical protein
MSEAGEQVTSPDSDKLDKLANIVRAICGSAGLVVQLTPVPLLNIHVADRIVPAIGVKFDTEYVLSYYHGRYRTFKIDPVTGEVVLQLEVKASGLKFYVLRLLNCIFYDRVKSATRKLTDEINLLKPAPEPVVIELKDDTPIFPPKPKPKSKPTDAVPAAQPAGCAKQARRPTGAGSPPSPASSNLVTATQVAVTPVGEAVAIPPTQPNKIVPGKQPAQTGGNSGQSGQPASVPSSSVCNQVADSSSKNGSNRPLRNRLHRSGRPDR